MIYLGKRIVLLDSLNANRINGIQQNIKTQGSLCFSLLNEVYCNPCLGRKDSETVGAQGC